MDRTYLLYYAALGILWFTVGQTVSSDELGDEILFLIAIAVAISLYFVYIEYLDWRRGRGNA